MATDPRQLQHHSARADQEEEDGANACLLRQHIIDSPCLPILAYIPSYVSAEEAQRLLREVNSSHASWNVVAGRRVLSLGGAVHPKGLLQAPLPRWLQPLLARVHADTGAFGAKPPNHVLVNTYNPGQGILPHQDGPAYHPAAAILSLGAAPAVIRFWRKRQEGVPRPGTDPPDASLLLMPNSLLVFAGEAYEACLHGICEVSEEQLDGSVCNLGSPDMPPGVAHGEMLQRGGERVSLTIRRVERVLRNLIRLAAS